MNKFYLLYRDRCKSLVELKDYNLLNDFNFFKDIIPDHDFKEIIREKQNRKNRRYRTDRKILEMVRLSMYYHMLNIRPKIVFGTLTLDDKTLSQKEDTYMRKISKYLKSHYKYVILNKDFGKTNEREHYHFIGLTIENIVKTENKSKKGFSMYKLQNQDYELGFEPVLEIFNIEDKKKVRNYLLKLNNHSNKDTTKNSRTRILKTGVAETILTDINRYLKT